MTDAADPLDEAIEAAANAYRGANLTTGLASYERNGIAAAVRAAAPIIAAPIQRVVADLSQDLSELFADRKDLRADRDRWKRQYGHCLAERDEARRERGEALRQRDIAYRAGDVVELKLRQALGVDTGNPPQLVEQVADLRARLATAERDTLARAADDAAKSDWSWLRIDAAHWLRERAKEAGGE